MECDKSITNKPCSIQNVSDTPTFEEWLDKYFKEPKMKKMYKTKSNSKEYNEEELRRKHKKAYSGCN